MAAVARIPAARSYRLCGLTLASSQALPGLAEGGSGTPDVVLSDAAIPEHLDTVTRRGPNWEIGEQTLLLRIPGIRGS